MGRKWEPAYEYKELKEYKDWEIDKNKIKEKYLEKSPKLFRITNTNKESKEYTTEQHNLYKQYLKELADKMFEPESSYQKLIWELIPENQLEEMERAARGRKITPKIYY